MYFLGRRKPSQWAKFSSQNLGKRWFEQLSRKIYAMKRIACKNRTKVISDLFFRIFSTRFLRATFKQRVVNWFYTATLSFPSALFGAKNSSWTSESEETPAKMVTSLVRVRNWRIKALPTGVPDGTTGALRSRERTDRTCKSVGEL